MIKSKQINRIMKKKKLLSILLVFIMAFAVPMSALAEEISETDSEEETETPITSDIDSVEETESLMTPDSEEYIAEEEPMKTVEDDTNIEAEIISAEEPQEDSSTEKQRNLEAVQRIVSRTVPMYRPMAGRIMWQTGQ